MTAAVPPRKRRCTRSSSCASEPAQSVHVPILTVQDTVSPSRQLEQQVVDLTTDGRSTEYLDWWRENQTDATLFGVRLVGDASQPENYTAMAVSDLAFIRFAVTSVKLQTNSVQCKCISDCTAVTVWCLQQMGL